jgi:hypothetical protein
MKSLVFILLLAGLEGCATSTHFKAIQSQVAPGKHYQNIYVHCNVQDMGERQTVEDQVVQQIATYGIPAKPSYEDFPTGSTATLAHKRLVVQALGFDAALFIKITNNNVTQEAVTTAITEVHHDPNREHSTMDIPGHPRPDEDDFVPTIVNIYTAHFTIATKLVDTQNFTPVWQATSKSKEMVQDPNDLSLEDIMKSYGNTLVNEWINEGVVLDMTKK